MFKIGNTFIGACWIHKWIEKKGQKTVVCEAVVVGASSLWLANAFPGRWYSWHNFLSRRHNLEQCQLEASVGKPWELLFRGAFQECVLWILTVHWWWKLTLQHWPLEVFFEVQILKPHLQTNLLPFEQKIYPHYAPSWNKDTFTLLRVSFLFD